MTSRATTESARFKSQRKRAAHVKAELGIRGGGRLPAVDRQAKDVVGIRGESEAKLLVDTISGGPNRGGAEMTPGLSEILRIRRVEAGRALLATRGLMCGEIIPGVPCRDQGSI